MVEREPRKGRDRVFLVLYGVERVVNEWEKVRVPLPKPSRRTGYCGGGKIGGARARRAGPETSRDQFHSSPDPHTPLTLATRNGPGNEQGTQ